MATIVYGKNAVQEYLHPQQQLQGTLYIAREASRTHNRDLEQQARTCGLRVIHCPRKQLDQRLPGQNHQGLLLEIRTPGGTPQHSDWRESLQQAIGQGQQPRVALLDRIQDPANLGAIVRSAAQFGISHVFLPRHKSAPFSEAARKSACGGDRHVSVVEVKNLAQTMETLQQLGFWIMTTCSEGEHSLWDMSFNSPFAILLGSEGDGVRPLLRDKSDFRVAIPTTGKLDSLNVSVAAAICFQEVFRFDRQREGTTN